MVMIRNSIYYLLTEIKISVGSPNSSTELKYYDYRPTFDNSFKI